MADPQPNPNINPITNPGVMTTEFWITVGSIIVSLLVGSGLLTTADTTQVNTALSSLAASIVNAVSVVFYIRHRTNLKVTQAHLVAENPDFCTMCGNKLTPQEKVKE